MNLALGTRLRSAGCTLAALTSLCCARSAGFAAFEPGACDFVVEEQVKALLGPELTVIENKRSGRSECWIIEGVVDPGSLTNYSIGDYNHLELRLLGRADWEQEKTPNPKLDRPLPGLGDEAYQLEHGGCGQIVTLRREERGFILSGCILRGESTPPEAVVAWAHQLAPSLASRPRQEKSVRHLAVPAPSSNASPTPGDHERFSHEFLGGRPRGRLRADVLAWLADRGCCLLEDGTNALVARCPQPAGAAKRNILATVGFDETGTLQKLEIEKDYRGSRQSPTCTR